MGHDAHGGSQNKVAELAGGEEVDDPLLDLVLGNIESGADNAALVEASRELNYDLAGPVIVDDLEFSDVSCCHLNGRRVVGREGKQNVRENTCSVLEWYVASVKAVPLHGRPVDWCGRARECKSYACCFSGAKKSGGGQSMHRVIAARRPFARTEAALSAMRAHTTRPRPRSTPTFAPLRSKSAGPSDFSDTSGNRK